MNCKWNVNIQERRRISRVAPSTTCTNVEPERSTQRPRRDRCVAYSCCITSRLRGESSHLSFFSHYIFSMKISSFPYIKKENGSSEMKRKSDRPGVTFRLFKLTKLLQPLRSY
jgi:hypothetical protein